MIKKSSGKKKPAYEYGSYELDEVPDVTVDPYSGLEMTASCTTTGSPLITIVSSDTSGGIDVEKLSNMVAEKVLNMLVPKTPEGWIKKALEAGMTLPEIGRAVVAYARGNENDGASEEKPVPEMPRGGKGSKRR